MESYAPKCLFLLPLNDNRLADLTYAVKTFMDHCIFQGRGLHVLPAGIFL